MQPDEKGYNLRNPWWFRSCFTWGASSFLLSVVRIAAVLTAGICVPRRDFADSVVSWLAVAVLVAAGIGAGDRLAVVRVGVADWGGIQTLVISQAS